MKQTVEWGFVDVANPSDTPETDAAQYIAVLTHQDDDEYVVPVDVARKIERDRDRIRARSQRQRRELRRLNSQIKALWKGFTRGVLAEDALNTRCAMAEKFGWDAVREAEHEYLKQRQDEAEKAK